MVTTLLAVVSAAALCPAQSEAPLPPGVKAVWDMGKARRETTPTRERLCINGLWRWQPAGNREDQVPEGHWGHFKVPGSWPGISDYMQKDSQTLHAHPAWKGSPLRDAAWYQREISIPAEWAGRRISVAAEYVSSYAVVFVDGKRTGEILYPWGEVDITAACRPGGRHVLSLFALAMPMKGVILSFNDTNAAREVKGSVARRGLCGDVFLVGAPPGARVADARVDTSVRKGEIAFEAGLQGLDAEARYVLRAEVLDGGRGVGRFESGGFKGSDLKEGRFAFAAKWKPGKLWDTHTPQNTYEAVLSLAEAGGKVLDAAHPVRFGFREFWIEGRDFYLNGTRIYLSSVPLDNAQIGAAWAGYEGARETMKRLQGIGINLVYTHNYDCMPGSHLSFAEILRAADDVGMLVTLSQPHFGHYDWKAPDADRANGYARHAEFYVRQAQNHPSVVMYAMSHNSTGYSEDMNPDLIDGIYSPKEPWSLNNARLAQRAEAIVRRLDPVRIVYHHSSGNLSSMHTSNFYPNWVPVQEMDDWFEHWATAGVKPVFTCEYAAPFSWDWTMYRGWYRGQRSFGSARVPWEFCIAEWNAQFLGDRAFQVSEREKRNLRWEARKSRAGEVWHRWDYPTAPGSRDWDENHPVSALYIAHNWRAFRTWGVSINSPWEYHPFWKLREGVDRGRRELKVDWENLQRPGYSADYLADRYEGMESAFERSDWIPTPAAQAILRNNGPLLAYLGGKPARFTSKDHNFFPGETVEKQLIVINNSREAVAGDGAWSLALPRAVSGSRRLSLPPGQQERVPLRFDLPPDLAPGAYELKASVKFAGGETQEDAFAIHVLPRPPAPPAGAKIALFDPGGETGKLLGGLGVPFRPVEPNADLAAFDVLVVGKGALAAEGPGPDLGRVRDGLKAVVFEQTSEALEKRLGFRVAEYGLRNVFRRVPDHPLLAGLEPENLRDWRGEATVLPPRLKYTMSRQFGSPSVLWCGIEVTRLWRCGCRGNVASVLIEKPACGDFLPVVDGGYSLQYSPLMEYREGKGMVLFCQMDVTGRTEGDPAAETLARNIVRYVTGWKPGPVRRALYAGDPAGRAHLEKAGAAPGAYEGGKLEADRVLVVGPGGGKSLAAHAAEIAGFLKAGGQLLAAGLDEAEANAFLPSKVSMKKAEHIASFFEPFGSKSPLAGIGPADVHNRDPRELPLVTGGAAAAGNGVLAAMEGAGVVFCQLTPWEIRGAPGAAASFSVVDGEAVEGKCSALVDLGSTAAEGGGQFGQRLKMTPEVGKTYTFAVLVRGAGGPARVRLEVERAGRPWDRAVKGPEVLVPETAWTELHVTFKVEKPFPEGWQAYVACAQEGGRFRADLFRLHEGEYVAWKAGAGGGGPNLFANPGFEAGSEPWWFQCGGQSVPPTPVRASKEAPSEPSRLNVRRTFRRSSFLLARALANLGVAGSTPLLGRFGSPASKAEKRWLEGLYLDQPQEWDDPYRFFRW